VPDRRSIILFCERAGLPLDIDTASRTISFDQYVMGQPLIPVDNDGLAALRRALVTHNFRENAR
jgi:hypothetical protein